MRKFAVAIIMILAGSSASVVNLPARAHDYWSNGHRVDPITKNLCCSGADTKELDPKLVKAEQGGFRLMDTNEFIPSSVSNPRRTTPSGSPAGAAPANASSTHHPFRLSFFQRQDAPPFSRDAGGGAPCAARG